MNRHSLRFLSFQYMRFIGMRCWVCTLAALLLVAMPHIPLVAQTQFGKNIISPKNPRRWYFLSSPNFEVHFYDRNKDLGEMAARYAEDAFNDVKRLLDYRNTVRFQIFVYSNPVDYLGGQTNQYELQSDEYHINRFTVYFNGSQNDLYRQIRTRMVNILMRQMIYAGGLGPGSLQTRVMMYTPDWYLTGMSNYIGEGWLPEDEAFMRGINKQNERFIEDAMRNPVPNRYISLKKSIWHMVAVSYGRRRLTEIMYVARLSASVEYAIKTVLGLGMNTFTLKWLDFVRSEFPDDKVPVINGQKLPIKLGGSMRVVNSAMSPDKKYFTVYAERSGVFRVLLFDLARRTSRELPVRFGRQNEMREIREVKYPITWSPDNRYILFTAPYDGKLQLVYYEVATRAITRYPIYEKLDWVSGLDWARDGVKIVASGTLNGQTDLYGFSKGNNTIVQLTNTPYDELSPIWGPDSKTLYYISNGGDSLGTKSRLSYRNSKQNYDIYSLSYPVAGKVPQRITVTPYANEWNLQILNNELFFLTDDNGLPNLARRSLSSNNAELSYLTDYNTGFNQFGFAGGDLVAVSPYRGKQRVFLFEQFDLRQPLQVEKTKTANVVYSSYTQNVIAEVRDAEIKARQDSLARVDSVAAKKADSTRKALTERRQRVIRFYVFDEREDTTRKTAKFARQRLARRVARPRPPLAIAFDIDRFRISKLRNPLFGLDVRQLFVTDYNAEPLFGPNLTAELELADARVHHRFIGGFRGFFDFRSFDAYMGHYFLRYRVQFESQFRLASRLFINPVDLIRYNTYSARFSLWYPITRYQRIGFEYEFINIDRRDLNLLNTRVFGLLPGVTFIDRNPGLFNGSSNMVATRINYVYDNTRKTDVYYDRGQRVKATLETYLSRERGSWGYSAFKVEARKYIPIFRGIVWANRFDMALTPREANRQTFMLGGVENWTFNQSFNNIQQIPVGFAVDQPLNLDNLSTFGQPIYALPEAYYFNNYVFPLRGFTFNARNGNNYGLFSTEIRLPFRRIFNFKLNTRTLYNFQMVGFFDAGVAWRNENPLQENVTNFVNTNGSFIVSSRIVSVPIIQGFGGGIRTILLGYVSRIDIAWGIENGFIRSPQIYFSFGRDF